MSKKWSELKRNMPPAAQARVESRLRSTLKAMPLAEIRKAIGLTQAELAERLEVAQGSVSKVESNTDMYLTTLRKYIEALGGELHLVASFADGRQLEIEQLSSFTPER